MSVTCRVRPIPRYRRPFITRDRGPTPRSRRARLGVRTRRRTRHEPGEAHGSRHLATHCVPATNQRPSPNAKKLTPGPCTAPVHRTRAPHPCTAPVHRTCAPHPCTAPVHLCHRTAPIAPDAPIAPVYDLFLFHPREQFDVRVDHTFPLVLINLRRPHVALRCAAEDDAVAARHHVHEHPRRAV